MYIYIYIYQAGVAVELAANTIFKQVLFVFLDLYIYLFIYLSIYLHIFIFVYITYIYISWNAQACVAVESAANPTFKQVLFVSG